MTAVHWQKLRLLKAEEYVGVNRNDPIRFYFWPIVRRLYCRRVELCLNECSGGERILEIGFGTGLTFINLSKLYKEIHGLDLTASVEKVAEVYKKRAIFPILKNGSVLSMPFPENHFDTVLLISILEHLRPSELDVAFSEIRRVLRPAGQVVYGVPANNPFMRGCFFALGYDIRKHHFSSEKDVASAAMKSLTKVKTVHIKTPIPFGGTLYEVGHYSKMT